MTTEVSSERAVVLVSQDLERVDLPGWQSLVVQTLADAGLTAEFWDPADPTPRPGVRGLLVNAMTIGTPQLDVLPDLTSVVRFGSGIDNIDVPECERRGITVRNTPDPIGREMAAATVSLVISRLLRLREKERRFREEGWGARFGIHAEGVAGSIVGLVGAGRIARTTAAALQAVGADVRFTSQDPRAAADPFGMQMDLDALCEAVDVLVVLSPLRDDTRNLIDAARIERLRRGAHLVVMGRGGVADQDAAIAALAAGRLGSLHLEVFTVEPFEARELPAIDGLTATAHDAAWGRSFFTNTLREAAARLSDAAQQPRP
ncbi:NAD(P)-dependent oxidoreductase [Agromyces aerolatus]|uniref:NAD(P)-dependent oxidoreductase n=1 Tax=Agromyces sp. LY-1074 TaxID=3074080 RepID=UPI00285DF0C0|nr:MULTISPECIES: NAD(P)-dependent oxidoreductase [unclassified Agromyces]MDR5701390.1 NAD(P)-dependent oxidoreductase [Agromyces sp. LY-1074]MDR5706821.1 NAD(P)-dependent oxidoreductase [Agromyces sp. LY-1358]